MRRASGEAAGDGGAAAAWPHPLDTATPPKLSLGPALPGAAKAEHNVDWTRHVA